jgi:cell wall-associated NlpC family hydrolase
VTDGVGTLGRGGVVIAMSSGLVATMGLPAQAVTAAASHPDAAKPAAAPVVGAEAALLSLPATLASGAALTAPATATVSFDRGVFTAAPASVPAPVRRAATSRSSTRTSRVTTVVSGFGSAKGASVAALAARYLGVPYLFGGETPGGWDCSGAMLYIFGLVGIHLPRTANDQMLATTRISSSQARAGDLVFFISGGRAYHVGLYAGNGMLFDAGRTGEVFQKRAIWTSSVVYTRVTG